MDQINPFSTTYIGKSIPQTVTRKRTIPIFLALLILAILGLGAIAAAKWESSKGPLNASAETTISSALDNETSVDRQLATFVGKFLMNY